MPQKLVGLMARQFQSRVCVKATFIANYPEWKQSLGKVDTRTRLHQAEGAHVLFVEEISAQATWKSRRGMKEAIDSVMSGS